MKIHIVRLQYLLMDIKPLIKVPYEAVPAVNLSFKFEI